MKNSVFHKIPRLHVDMPGPDRKQLQDSFDLIESISDHSVSSPKVSSAEADSLFPKVITLETNDFYAILSLSFTDSVESIKDLILLCNDNIFF